MLNIIQFENGRFGLQNAWTGIILTKKGKVRSYRSIKRASRASNRIMRELQKTVQKVTDS